MRPLEKQPQAAPDDDEDDDDAKRNDSHEANATAGDRVTAAVDRGPVRRLNGREGRTRRVTGYIRHKQVKSENGHGASREH